MSDERLSYEQWEELEAGLAALGFQPHYTYHDHNAVIMHPCERDGGTMDYVGLKHPVTKAYRAFAICRKCHTVLEF